ncbi:hypothetical protein NDU88_004664, partial [Pleurodeles waltl]
RYWVMKLGRLIRSKVKERRSLPGWQVIQNPNLRLMFYLEEKRRQYSGQKSFAFLFVEQGPRS